MSYGNRSLLSAVVLLICSSSQLVLAEPYLAVRQGLKCVACHVNPTGGGLRNDFGITFAKQVLPAQSPENIPDWSGKIADLLRVGGDLRTSWSDLNVPNQDGQRKFALDQLRLYGDVTLIPERLGLYIDQQVAPDSAITQEAYVRYGNQADGWYLKGGKFYLPFGLRLQDYTSLVRQATGTSMLTPDTGVEIGYESAQWSAQLAATNGVLNLQQQSGHQITSQLAWVHSLWRVGAAASMTQSDLGDLRMGGLFAGLRTGPLVWLAETDLIRQDTLPAGHQDRLAALGEVNWLIRTGHNLKLTAELFEPDRDVDSDQQKRWSLVYELTPLPFVQLRAGYRRYDGIAQDDLQNRRLTFVELHGFF